MTEQVIFRVKNIATESYWNGNGFGSGGKIYTKRKFANGAMTDGRLGHAIENGTYEVDNIKIVRATIMDEEEV